MFWQPCLYVSLALTLGVAFFALYCAVKGKKCLVYLLALLLLLPLDNFLWIVSSRYSQTQQCAENLSDIANAVEFYSQTDSHVYPDSLDRLMPFYFEDIPQCPAATERHLGNTYLKSYRETPENFTIICNSAAHKGLGGAGENFPQYSFFEGLNFGN